MSNLSQYVYTEGDKFYFDSENYDDGTSLAIKFENGDMIKWDWDGKTMAGILQEEGFDLGLYRIINPKPIE